MNKIKVLTLLFFSFIILLSTNKLLIKADTMSELEDSIPISEWNASYNGYNCYAYAINRIESPKNYKHEVINQPGYLLDYKDYTFGDASGVDKVVERTVADLQRFGMEDIQVLDYIPSTVDDNQELICTRVSEYDYHFMRYDKETDAWYHKPYTSAILKYKYVPSNNRTWSSEGLYKDGFGYSQKKKVKYDSNIKFILYTKPYIKLSCDTKLTTDAIYINKNCDLFYELDINCSSDYTFNIESNESIRCILYDCNQNQLVFNPNITNFGGEFDYYFSKGKYYLCFLFQNVVEGTVNLSFRGKYSSYNNEVLKGENNLKTHSHKLDSDDYYLTSYFINTDGNGFYNFSLDVIKNNENLILSEGSIQIFDYNNINQESKCNNILSQNTNNSNNLSMYLNRSGYYYIRISIEDNDFDSVKLNISKIDYEHLNILNDITKDIDINLINSSSEGDFVKGIEIDVPLKVILTCTTLLEDTNIIFMSKNEILYFNNKSFITELILQPDTYYIGYFNKNNNENIRINLKRIIQNVINDNIMCDPGNGYTCGSEVKYNNGLYNQNIITEGFTRHLYFANNDVVPSYSRLNYEWYTSNSSAKVSKYGTVLALNVNSNTNCQIYAIYKLDPSIIFEKEIQILKEVKQEEIIIILNKTYNYNNGIIQLDLNDNECPYPWIQYYDWCVNEAEEESNEVTISPYGVIKISNTGQVIATGRYKLNNRVTIMIGINVI